MDHTPSLNRREFIFKSSLAVAATAVSVGAPAADQRDSSSVDLIPDIFSWRGGYRPQIDLNGPWQFRRDPDNRGKEQGWQLGKAEFSESIKIPGVPQAQGIGEPREDQKTAFLEPFWVRRSFMAPELSSRKRLWLRVGGILPAAEIYVNGSYVAYTKSSRTPQRVDVTRLVKPGAENLVAIKVCDFPEIRLDGVLEWKEGNQHWTGLYQPIGCEVTDRVSVIDAYVQPRLSSGSVVADIELSEPPSETLTLILEVKDGHSSIGTASVNVPKGQKHVRAVEVKMNRFLAWSPDHPQLYMLQIILAESKGPQPVDHVAIRFGMREISVSGTKFYLNGKPLFQRFFGDIFYYPHTLCPPWDKDWYVARLKQARAYGMNGVKSCVETLPLPYIEAADEVGFIVHQEMPFGLSSPIRENREKIGQEFREYDSKELDGLVRVSRNHASVLSYSMASELNFKSQTQESFDFFSQTLTRQTKKLAPHALVTDCTGYLATEETKKGKRAVDFYSCGFPTWVKDVFDENEIKTDGLHPTTMHEYHYWSCYPDPADKDKYADTQLKPFWLDTLVKTAWANGQGELIPTYRKNSLWLQALCRKDGIEYTRRHASVTGYALWLLVDDGHWSEGLLDDFWNRKNVSPEEFLKSNGDTVIVLAKEGNRCLKMMDRARIPLALSHYGGEVLRGCTLRWRAQGDSISREGALEIGELRPGELMQAGYAEFDVPDARKAYKIEIQVALYHHEKVVNENEWSFWAFPEVPEPARNLTAPENAGKTTTDGIFVRLNSARSQVIPAGVPLVVADTVDQALADSIEAGGKCIVFGRGMVIENTALYGTTSFYKMFRPIPWNGGNSGNSGTVISYHPAMEAFPHEGMCDLPFVWMIRGSLPMEFSPLRQYGVAPIIRGIDHYVSNRSNAYMLEFNVGKGKVLVVSLGVLQNLNEHIEAGYLLSCLLAYARGTSFEPAAAILKQEFLKLFSQRKAS